MNFVCPNCNTSIPEEDYNQRVNIAKCVNCGEVFVLSGLLRQDKERAYKNVNPNQKGFTVKDTASNLVIDLKWGRMNYNWLIISISMLPFFYFTFPFFKQMFIDLLSTRENFSIFILVFWSIFLIFFAYPLGASLISNLHRGFAHTIITVSHTKLKIEQIPFQTKKFKNSTILKTEIDQLYVQKFEVRKSKKRKPIYGFQLRVRLHDQTDFMLIPHFELPKYALMLESQIEKRLEIKDRTLKKEYNPVEESVITKQDLLKARRFADMNK